MSGQGKTEGKQKETVVGGVPAGAPKKAEGKALQPKPEAKNSLVSQFRALRSSRSQRSTK